MENSNDSMGNRNRNLPACSILPQPTASSRGPVIIFLVILKTAYWRVLQMIKLPT
jgi:hypothetical protein